MHEKWVQFAGTWGLIYMLAIFAGAVVYALWPRNKAKFDRAARLPLIDDDDRPPAGPAGEGVR